MSGTDDKTTIATLTAQLAEARAMVGAVIERAANLCDIHERVDHPVASLLRQRATAIRALDPDATAALSSIKREAEDAGIKIGLRAASRITAYMPGSQKSKPILTPWKEAILALTPDEARKLGEEE